MTIKTINMLIITLVNLLLIVVAKTFITNNLMLITTLTLIAIEHYLIISEVNR